MLTNKFCFKLLFKVKLIYSIQVLGPWLWGNKPFFSSVVGQRPSGANAPPVHGIKYPSGANALETIAQNINFRIKIESLPFSALFLQSL
jgi:hypothetical protein